MPRHNPISRNRARELRQNATTAESILWRQLRNRRFASFKFRRQHVIGPYIVDFICRDAAVVVELDGDSHRGREQHDKVRQDWLESKGLKILRFFNTDVDDNLDNVLEKITVECMRRIREQQTPHPAAVRPPSPQWGEG